jgi:hypothetical protein
MREKYGGICGNGPPKAPRGTKGQRAKAYRLTDKERNKGAKRPSG